MHLLGCLLTYLLLCAYSQKKQQKASCNQCYLIISKLHLWMDEEKEDGRRLANMKSRT